MTCRKTIILVCCVLCLLIPGVSANVLSVVPASTQHIPGEVQSYAVILDSAPDALSGFNITITVENPAIAEIIGVSYNLSWASMPANSTVPADSIWCKAVDLGGSSGVLSITLCNVMVRADSPGMTNITVIPSKVEDRIGGRYTPTVNPAILTVQSGPGASYTVTNISAPSAYEPLTVRFTDTSTGGPMLSRVWNFGDGNSSWSAGAATTLFTHTYADRGSYMPSLTVTNGVGPSTATSGGNTPIDVRLQPNASAMFVFYPAMVGSGQPVVFTDLSRNATYWRWSFSDGNSSYLNQSCSHIFPTTPTDRIYNVSLNVSGIRGPLSNITFDIRVVALVPIPEFTTTNLSSAYEPMTLLFTDTSAQGPMLSRVWNFGDGNSSWSAGAATTSFTHTYLNPGLYMPTLTVTNSVGPATVTSGGNTPIGVRVQPNATPMFTYTPAIGPTPLTVRFTDTSQNATYWEWDFGDGNSSWVAQHVTHTFTASTDTVYNVRHSVRGIRGGLSNVTFPVEVRAGFTATFNANITSGIVTGAGQAVNFTYLTPGASNWTWDFGDNSVFTRSHAGKILPLVNHTYTQNGTFSVSLVANDSVLSNGNLTRGNYITFGLAPSAFFTLSNLTIDVARPGEAAVTDGSANVVNLRTPATYLWNFGNGTTATGPGSYSLYYADVGVYRINLTVTNHIGTSTFSRDITIQQAGMSRPILTIPDVRMPPGVNRTISVRIENVSRATAVGFVLTYNPAIIRVSNITANASIPGTQLEYIVTNSTGRANISLTFVPVLIANRSRDILDVTIWAAGTPGQQGNISAESPEYSDDQFNTYPLNLVEGHIQLTKRGDFNYNGRVDIGDVARVAYMVVSLTPQDSDADFNSNGYIDAGDAAKIAWYYVGKISVL